MLLTKAGIALRQIYRVATHIRRFEAAVSAPARAQEQKLLQIIEANQETAFGRQWGFKHINSIEDYQRQVPPARYENLHPYIERLMNGEKNQLTAEEPFMFACTSGTTAQPKFIPITESHLLDYTHAFQIHNYHLLKDRPGSGLGKFLIISSNDEEGFVPSGKPYGAVSGLLSKRQPSIIRNHFSVPYELCKIRDVDIKYYLMLRIALAQNVTAVLCCNPSSLLLLADQMKEHAADLVDDIARGTLKKRYAPPAVLEEAFAPYLTPQPQRSRQLSALLAKHGTLTPQLVWPNIRPSHAGKADRCLSIWSACQNRLVTSRCAISDIWQAKVAAQFL